MRGAVAKAALDLLADFDRVFAVLRNVSDEDLDEYIRGQIAAREQARKDKQWAESDRIRDELLEKGITLEDTPEGTIWRRG